MTDDELERRLQGWALWRNGAGRGYGGTTSSIYLDKVPDRYRETSAPRIDGEAMDVDRVVNDMGEGERVVLTLVYLHDKFQAEAARELRCSLSTVERRLRAARSQVAEGLRALRHRVDALRVN